MNKDEIIQALIAALLEEFQKACDAAEMAASHATDPESRAESKWDTQGLEAAYLAGGQTKLAIQRSEDMSALRNSRQTLNVAQDSVTTGAVVKCNLAGKEEFFFISPVGGGKVLKIDGEEITVITVHSPIMRRISGRRAGESFVLENGAAGTILSIE